MPLVGVQQRHRWSLSRSDDVHLVRSAARISVETFEFVVVVAGTLRICLASVCTKAAVRRSTRRFRRRWISAVRLRARRRRARVLAAPTPLCVLRAVRVACAIHCRLSTLVGNAADTTSMHAGVLTQAGFCYNDLQQHGCASNEICKCEWCR